MEEAVNKIVDLSNDSEFISQLERQQIEEYARGVALEEIKEEAEEKGKQNEKIEIAKNLLKENVDINIISTSTGLSNEEIKKL